MPTHLYLIRHGEAASNLVNGTSIELGLSPEGQIQAGKLRERLARTGEISADVLLASPLQRAHETADVIAPALNLPVTAESGLEEWRADNGRLTDDEFMSAWQRTPDAQKPFYRFTEGCETWIEFSARAYAVLHRILQDYEGKSIVAVTHGGVIHAAFGYFFNYGVATLPPVAFDLKRASITHWFTGPSGRWTLERFNDDAHLV